jgi:hypothetical protein
MKHYESYVAEAQARRRQRVANGITGALMLAALALWALLAFKSPPVQADKPAASQSSAVAADRLADSTQQRSMPADLRADGQPAARDTAARYR